MAFSEEGVEQRAVREEKQRVRTQLQQDNAAAQIRKKERERQNKAQEQAEVAFEMEKARKAEEAELQMKAQRRADAAEMQRALADASARRRQRMDEHRGTSEQNLGLLIGECDKAKMIEDQKKRRQELQLCWTQQMNERLTRKQADRSRDAAIGAEATDAEKRDLEAKAAELRKKRGDDEASSVKR